MDSSEPAAPNSQSQGHSLGRLQLLARGARLPLGLVSLIGFLLALAVHFAAVFGVDVEAASPKVWLLYYGVFPVMLLFIAATNLLMGRQRRFRDLVAHIPMVSRLLIVALCFMQLQTSSSSSQ